MSRDDFPAAVEGSQTWVREALTTINRLEYQLESSD
jgi:hypothetical protein